LKKFEDMNYQKYGGFWKFFIMTKPVYCVADPTIFQLFLTDRPDSFPKGYSFEVSKLLFGIGLVLSQGPYWQQQRKLLNHGFAPSKLTRAMPRIIKCMDVLIEHLDEKLKASPDHQITEELWSLTLRLGIDFITTVLYGFPSNNVCGDDHLFTKLNTVYSSTDKVKVPPPVPFFLRTLVFKKYWSEVISAASNLHELLDRMVNERVSLAQKGEGSPYEDDTGDYEDLFDLMINFENSSGEKLTKVQLRDEVASHYAGGTLTTAVVMAFGLRELAKSPRIIQNIRSEADRVLGSEVMPTSQKEISEMTYVNKFISEVLRLYPALPNNERINSNKETLTTKDGKRYTIAANSKFLLSPYYLQRNEDLFKKAEEFIPERFDESPPQFNFQPFLSGPHNCIGQNLALLELRIFFAAMAKRYNFEIIDDIHPLQVDFKSTIVSRTGVWLKITRR